MEFISPTTHTLGYITYLGEERGELDMKRTGFS